MVGATPLRPTGARAGLGYPHTRLFAGCVTCSSTGRSKTQTQFCFSNLSPAHRINHFLEVGGPGVIIWSNPLIEQQRTRRPREATCSRSSVGARTQPGAPAQPRPLGFHSALRVRSGSSTVNGKPRRGECRVGDGALGLRCDLSWASPCHLHGGTPVPRPISTTQLTLQARGKLTWDSEIPSSFG